MSVNIDLLAPSGLVQRHGGANESLQRLLVDRLTLVKYRWRAWCCLRGWR
jgi:hypothetical protein